MLLRLFYVYNRSPKRLKELVNIVDDLGEVFKLKKCGDLPICCHGTRWITHKRKALQRVVDRYGTYIAHLVTQSEDRSVIADDRAQLRGHFLKW